MCENEYDYNPFPSVTIGGPPGNYALRPPVSSSEHMEFVIISVANVTPNNAIVQVSGIDIPLPIDTTGASIYSDTAFIRSQVITVPFHTTLFTSQSSWEQIARSDKALFVRIDGLNTVAFITIKFRAKILKVIPGPIVTNRYDMPEETHLEREKRIRRAVWGEEGEAIEYGVMPVENERVRELELSSPVKRGGWW